MLAQNRDGRPLSLGPCSALSSVREGPSPFLSPVDGPSKSNCLHHLPFLRQDLPSTVWWGRPSSGFTTSTLSGASKLSSSAGVDLLLPTRAQWQLVCEASLTWRLGSNNLQAGRLLGGKVQGQWWEVLQALEHHYTKQLRVAALWLRNWLLS